MKLGKVGVSLKIQLLFFTVKGNSLARPTVAAPHRSEEHTSELQSRQYLVCRLLLEKKKTKQIKDKRITIKKKNK